MKLMKKSLLGAAVVAALGFASTAQAGVVIDLFADPVAGQSVATSTLNTPVTNQNAVAFATTSVIGGFRDLSIEKTDDTIAPFIGANSGESRLTAGGGALSVDNATGNKSVAIVTWDGSNDVGANGVNAFGLGGVDITAGGSANSFLASILAADLGFDYKITLWDMDGSKSVLEAGVQFGLNSTIAAGYQFSWFNLNSGTYCDGIAAPPACTDPTTQLDFKITRTDGLIDFTQIGAIQLELSNASTISVDLAIGSIQTVPEPGALALVGVALMGAGLATRRRKAIKV